MFGWFLKEAFADHVEQERYIKDRGGEDLPQSGQLR
jgi:hypothetical protein